MDLDALIEQMTLEEKAGLCSGLDFWHTKGVERLGIPSVMVTDGPHGLRKQGEKADNLGINDSVQAVCFPSAAGTASSFNRELLERLGETLGEESRAEDVSVLLGPAVNIKRSPLCGRNFEYFSEDPYLTAELAEHYINGVQSKHVGVSMKHFAANNQECRRMSVSDVVDERTLREIYLAAFEGAVKKAKPWTMMCSYNKINGTHSSDNEWLLTKVLRDEWGFDGYVMTDWGAVHDRVAGLKAGLELEMPSSGGVNDQKIVEAVRAGTLDEAVLDRACRRILDIVFRYAEHRGEPAQFDRAAHHQLAREMARECMVLLKNDGILPLEKGQKLAFIGKFAKEPRYQGGGSSHINPYRVDGALEAAREMADITYAQGYDTKADVIDERMVREAVEAARNAQAVVIFAGLPDAFESEGYDRTHLNLPRCQTYLIEEVCKVQPNTVVVLHNGSPVVMPWLDKVRAVLESYLGGEAVGGAQADILFGEANPSGKLAETFPKSIVDTPCANYFPGNQLTVEYREGIYVGYRYYDTANKEVLFPFGHGLSYTTFAYSNLTLDKKNIKETSELTVSFQVKNTGDRDGAEVVQLYVADPQSTVYKPEKELKGFAKVFLKAGQKKTVKIELDSRAFAYYNTELHDWHVETGTYHILIGASSRDIRLKDSVKVTSAVPEFKAQDQRDTLPAYYAAQVSHVPDEQFEALIGHPIPPVRRPFGAPIDGTCTLNDVGHTKWGARLLGLLEKAVSGDNALGEGNMMLEVVKGAPFNTLSTLSQGLLSADMLDGLLHLLNDQTAYGVSHLLKGGLETARKIQKDGLPI